MECCCENPEGHWESCDHSHRPGQTSARLGQRHHVRHCVDETWTYKHSEVQQSRGEIRPRQCIQETDHHKGNDVLQIILMASVIKEQKSLRIYAINRLNEDRSVLLYYLRTRSTSELVWSIFFLSSGSFLIIAVSSKFWKDCVMNRNTLIIVYCWGATLYNLYTRIIALDPMFKLIIT